MKHDCVRMIVDVRMHVQGRSSSGPMPDAVATEYALEAHEVAYVSDGLAAVVVPGQVPVFFVLKSLRRRI